MPRELAASIARRRYKNDRQFQGLVDAVLGVVSDRGCCLSDLKQAVQIIEDWQE